ncbi:helix-turn-helix transcriptional regulator [Streptomyces sp. VRA16 Mangrove soil]|uniref:helix-turn-helix domain-containing protein n=1 Tax=Streptomyces sp. VRA16 Mangrove soil TaxID=2817434 RepID=UPI001A9E9242|nr:helix-turn-helix transcriptional regulator [Streptomyces sp. VRA16 Mangrove soil]MBO1334834.1 helix-turn-helix domain-containing protein [Streptomyces sp. VRA16 Mangrove soil]
MAIEDNPGSRTSYGEELRRRREAAGLTQEELSVRAVMSRTHIAHIEAGRRRPSLDDARRLDKVLGTGGVFENFLPTQGEGAVAEHFEEALRLEEQATAIRVYGPKLVPGLLQTPAYAREVLASGFPPRTQEECDKLLVTRVGRARVLDDFKTPLVWTILDEAVLRRPIGGPAVMCEQLRHIVELGEAHRVRVHVLPFSAGLHALVEGFVSLMWFDDLPPVAYVEGLNTGRVLEVPSVVRRCQLAYDHAMGDALSHRKSLALIRSTAEDYDHAAQRE